MAKEKVEENKSITDKLEKYISGDDSSFTPEEISRLEDSLFEFEKWSEEFKLRRANNESIPKKERDQSDDDKEAIIKYLEEYADKKFLK